MMNQTPCTSTQNFPPLLNEFRIALHEEIDAAKRTSSSNALPLSNGHKIGEQAGEVQYSFILDSVLNTPDGTPCNLLIPGQSPIDATIVSAEGLRLVLSVKIDLGKFVPSARLQTDLTILMRKLIERIEKNSLIQNPAAERMLGFSPATGQPVTLRNASHLNNGQLGALQNALGCNLTVIWGPPGTGKTYTIGTIAEHLYLDSRSVLLVSHTNIAVDQAIRHIASSLKDQLAGGAVVRIGTVSDEVLKSDYPDVLLAKQVERRSRELVEERNRLLNKRQAFSDEISTAQQAIGSIEWLKSASVEIALIYKHHDQIEKLQTSLEEVNSEYEHLGEQQSTLLEQQAHAVKILSLKKTLLSQINEAAAKKLELQSSVLEIDNLAKKSLEHDSRIEISNHLVPIRKEFATYPSLIAQRANIANISKRIVESQENLETVKSKFEKARSLLSEIQNSGVLSRLFRRLPKQEDQHRVVSGLLGNVTSLEAELLAAEHASGAATAKLGRMIELDGELSRYKDIGTPDQERNLKVELERKAKRITLISTDIKAQISVIESEILKNKTENAQLTNSLNGDAESVYKEVCIKLEKFKKAQERLKSDKEQISELRAEIKHKLLQLFATVQEWIDGSEHPSIPEKSFSSIQTIHENLASKFSSLDVSSLSTEIDELRKDIHQINIRISEIESKLTEVERDVICDAKVLGATLTKTYLSDIVQSRKFDTVILDEASMAPIPALWAAALLAEKNLIIVGDFKQLPPIVISNNDLSRKWLGRDIFEASGLVQKYNSGTLPPHFISLVEQRRMLPQIAQVANLFYDGNLKNTYSQPDQYKDYQSFTEWYVKDWSHDNPIVLVDTGALNAWVTSVVKGGSSSRLNFLSATVAVDLAEQLISPDKCARKMGSSKRILIVSPYRAHAKLVSLLIRDTPSLRDDVDAGTAHSFQGSEADVVIFDMVVDEPHFRVNLFMPSLDDQLKCLLNVALTRAKFRLFVVGDFDYCHKTGKKAFLGRELIPMLLQKFPRVDARVILPNGLAARAAKAQMTMLGGQIDTETERLIVTQSDFYRLLSTDLTNGKERVIIYSPFLTSDRVSFLLPQFQAAIDRSVGITVITKAHAERTKAELPIILKIEQQLSKIGIVVVHKLRMHEKLIFIDSDITWSGSLNPLSFSSTQEIMERRKSKVVLNDYFQILRLNDLLKIPGQPEFQCPICGDEMIAAEGKDQPYYWRCVRDNCFTRGIDQPYPLDGKLSCSTCNSAFEFGYWGSDPHWRCTENNRHRQKIYKSHLRLPKMSALVPKAEQKKVCQHLQIANFDEFLLSSNQTNPRTPVQMNIFN